MSATPKPTPEPPRQQAISLEALTEAFAQAMGEAPRAEAEAQPEPTAADPLAEPAGPPDAEFDRAPDAAEPDDPCPLCPRSILEAMLFVGNRGGRPLSARQAAEPMRGVESSEVPGLVDELNRRYAAGGCPYHVVGEGDGYRLTLRKGFHSLRDRFYGRVREARLSQAAIDVLAIVAYQQPLTAEQVGRLRGKPSNHVLTQLVHRRLLRIERDEVNRRVARYRTTDRFLKLFGLESLDDLPQSEEPG